MKIAVIGLGGRLSDVWSMLKLQCPEAELSAVCDVKPAEALKEQLRRLGENPETCALFTDPEEMLAAGGFEGVMVGTRCSLHSKMGQLVLNADLPLYLEKPIATNRKDLEALKAAGAGKEQRVVIGFPLRVTQLVLETKKMIKRGDIGEPMHMYAWNNPNYGDTYYQSWYRDNEETQGLWLQKATHDLDYMVYILEKKPVRICAMTSKKVFDCSKPAGKYCVDCDETDCKQHPYQRVMFGCDLDRMPKKGDRAAYGRMCSFGEDAKNEDSGSCLIGFEDGSHAVYTQCFYARKKAGNRGCRVIGYDGTIEFDWTTSQVKLFRHHCCQDEVISCNPNGIGHGGGDVILVQSFLDIIRGKGVSCSDLNDGILSVEMCMAAMESSATNTFVEL
ncbi:MAG: Gfo/Idh/MocA family oxidoreductase [Abditibacteriota bacterium]|nr:Gfo/Idh/MocA family oxidoreductase [Abditibacteriota bacterium]